MAMSTFKSLSNRPRANSNVEKKEKLCVVNTTTEQQQQQAAVNSLLTGVKSVVV